MTCHCSAVFLWYSTTDASLALLIIHNPLKHGFEIQSVAPYIWYLEDSFPTNITEALHQCSLQVHTVYTQACRVTNHAITSCSHTTVYIKSDKMPIDYFTSHMTYSVNICWHCTINLVFFFKAAKVYTFTRTKKNIFFWGGGGRCSSLEKIL